MIDLDFHVEGAQAVACAASPQLIFAVRISQVPSPLPVATIQSVLLRCQIRIEPVRRRYNSEDPDRLADLFGRPDRWGQTMRSMFWTHTQAIVGAFNGTTSIELPVPCTYDFNVAATKYFAALEDGEIPLCLLFSGTVFYRIDDGPLQVDPVSWEKLCDFRLDVSVWKQMMDLYYPKTAWLEVRKDLFERLLHYRSQHGLPTWERALEHLLAAEEEPSHAAERVGS